MQVLASAQGKPDPNAVIASGLADVIVTLRNGPQVIPTSGAPHGVLDPPLIRGAGRINEKRFVTGVHVAA